MGLALGCISLFPGARCQIGLCPICGCQWGLVPNPTSCPKGISPGGFLRTCPSLIGEHTAVFLWALSLAGLPFLLSSVPLGTQPTSSRSALCIHWQPLPDTCRLELVRLSLYSPITCLCPALCLE